jgi:Coenzyme PQQ synthesis protein D (PqqD)
MAKVALPTPGPNVAHTQLANGEAVLLHLEKRKYYVLNVTAARIWDMLTEGRDADEIAAGLADEFEVDVEHAKGSVSRMLSELDSRGFLRGVAGQ